MILNNASGKAKESISLDKLNNLGIKRTPTIMGTWL